MKVPEFVLALINASGGAIRGRTMLQKRAYFASLLGAIDIGFGYQAYYYGPYSSEIDAALTQLKNLGFIEEATTGFGVVSGGFEMRRYDYRLTEDGLKVVEPLLGTPEYRAMEEAIRRIQGAGDPNYFELSIAAKAYYILAKQGKEMSRTELQREAQKFDWNIQEESLAGAIRFLEQVGLATGA
jgi:DNA-binding PadR family transcriptional regulator